MNSTTKVKPRLDIEKFSLAADAQLIAAPYYEHGICFRPECSARFDPSRDWQIYCCRACELASVNEFRMVGHRAALPLLIHRIGKYEKVDEAVKDRTRMSRNWISRLQSAWREDRLERRERFGDVKL